MRLTFKHILEMQRALRENTAESEELDCVGCGFCCSLDLCQPGKLYFLQKGQTVKPPCPALVWRDGRYWCSLVGEFSEEEKREGLKLGQGCGRRDSLWRARIKKKDS